MRYFIKLVAVVFIIINIVSCKQNVTQNDYPDADAVYLKISKEYTLNEDGSMDYHYTHKLKLFSYFAFNSKYGETFVVYNPAFQKLKVNTSLTTDEKGMKIPSPENAFNEVLPGFAANAPAFNGLREMVITHTGLEKNVTIDLDYNITTQKDFLPVLMSNEVLNTSSPVREYEITVKIPKGKKLNYKLLNSDKKPDSTVNEKYVIYNWKLNELAQQPLENFQPYDNSHLVRLIFSTSDNLNSVLGNVINQKAFKYEINNEMKREAEATAKENKTELKIALALQKKVVEEFNYFPVPSSYIGYKCRTAAEVWKSNGGTEIEKAVLLNSLLKNAGINSEIIAVSSPYITEKDKIGLLLDNYYVKATLKTFEVIYLSPVHVNDYNAINDINGDLYYALAENSKLQLLSEISGKNAEGSEIVSYDILVQGKLKLDDKGALEGNINTLFANKFNPYFKLILTADYAKSMFGSVKDFKIIKNESTGSVIDYTIENKKAYQKENNYMFMNIPEVNNGVSSWGLNLLAEKRNTPVEISSAINEKYEYEIQIPDNFNLLTPKTAVNVKNNLGFVNISIEQNGNILSVKKEILLYNKIIESRNYDKLKAIIDPWLNKKYREIIIKN